MDYLFMSFQNSFPLCFKETFQNWKCFGIPRILENLAKLSNILGNTHRIRKSHGEVIGGIPNQLFYIPKNFGFQNYGLEVTENLMGKWLEEVQINPKNFGFQNYGLEVTEEDISNINGIENGIEPRYGGADYTDQEL